MTVEGAVVEVYAARPGEASGSAGGWSCGSGFVVGARLVLTAAHVVFGPGRPLPVVRVRRLGEAELRTARVVWPTVAPGQSDAALVVVEDPRWVPVRRRHPVRWGRLVTTQPGQRFEAVGFPEVVATPRCRDTEQASGTINPGSLVKSGKLALRMNDPPERVRCNESPWAGMSGAGVLVDGLLTAVVCRDPAGFDSHRLVAVPVTELVADPEFVRLVGEHTGGEVLVEPVEFQPFATISPAVDTPAALLRADVAPMPFRDRPELAELAEWCTRPGWLSTRLVVGPGGQGKTRLARHLAGQLSRQGWACVLVERDAPEEAFEVLRAVRCPALVMVDYAESRAQQLVELIKQLERAEQDIRLLLLARTAGSWQRDLADLSAHLTSVAHAPVLGLTPLETSETGRRNAWTEAVLALAGALGAVPGYDQVAWAQIPPRLTPPPLSGDRYRTILGVQMDALAALLRAGVPEISDAADPAQVLLLHEQWYWTTTATARNVPLGTKSQRRAVTAATLWGATSETEAIMTLTGIPGLRDLTEDELLRTAEWLAVLYRDSTRYWARPQPDRLAEHLIGTVLAADDSPQLITDTADGRTADQFVTAVMVLSQAVVHHPHLATALTALITAHPEQGGAAICAVAPRAEQPAVLTTALRATIPKADFDLLWRLSDRLPHHSLVLAETALFLCQTLTDRLRKAAQADTEKFLPDLAASLNNLANRLGEVGQHPAALTPAHEATQHYRRLADTAPDAYLPDLAMSLNNLAIRLGAVGRPRAALTPAHEATQHYRHLAEAMREMFAERYENAQQLLRYLKDED